MAYNDVFTSMRASKYWETQAYVFALNSLGWQIGNMLAPIIGGLFAKPAVTWPSAFSDTIWDRYPFALPGFVVALIPAVSVFLGIFKARETLKKEDRKSFRSSFPCLWKEKVDAKDSLPLRGMFTRGSIFILLILIGWNVCCRLSA